MLRATLSRDLDPRALGDELVLAVCLEIYGKENPSDAEISAKRRDVVIARVQVSNFVNELGELAKGRELESEEEFQV